MVAPGQIGSNDDGNVAKNVTTWQSRDEHMWGPKYERGSLALRLESPYRNTADEEHRALVKPDELPWKWFN